MIDRSAARASVGRAKRSWRAVRFASEGDGNKPCDAISDEVIDHRATWLRAITSRDGSAIASREREREREGSDASRDSRIRIEANMLELDSNGETILPRRVSNAGQTETACSLLSVIQGE